MPEPTNNLATEQVKRPDWLVANMQGAIPKTLGGMHKEGVAASMFDIAAPEEYWSSDKIRAAFTDEAGTERRDLFDDFYNKQKENYNSYRVGEHALLNYNSSPNVTAKKSNIKTPQAVIYKSKPDPMGRSYSSLTGYSGPEHSIREAAIKRGGKLADGSYIKPEEYKGLLRFAREDNGDWKYDEEGHPYLEPFDREKNLRQFDEIYNPTAKDWGYYGHTWDWIMLASSVPKNFINFFVSALDSLAEYPKSLLANLPGEAGGGEEGDAYKGIVSAENWAKQARIGNTDEGSEFFSLENITDLGQQVFYQLASMRAVGKGVGSITGSPHAGSVASKIYMVGLAAGPMAEVARENGLSQREQALMLGLTTGLFYPLMSLSENALGALATQESQAAMRDLMKPLGVAVKSGSRAEMAAQVLNVRSSIANFAYNVEKTVPKNGWGQMARGSALEATEEVAEQAVDLGLRTLYNGYNAVSQGSDIAQMLNTQPNTRFEIDPVRELQAMGHSAIGGAIGGSIASRLFGKWNNENNEVARQLHDMVLDGKEKVFYDYIKNMHEAGRLDHAWVTSKEELAKPGDQTKNDEAYNILKGVADYLVELRDNAGIKDLYRNNNAKAGAFKELLKTSSVGKDVADLHRDILALQTRLDSEKANKTPNTEQIGQTEAELQSKVEMLNKIKNGEFVTDYVVEGLYNLAAISGSRPNLNVNILAGKGFNTLTNAINAIQSEETTQADQFNLQLGQGDATATLDNFQDISEAGKQRLIEEGIVNLQRAGADLDPIMESLQDLAASTTGDQLEKDNLINTDPSKRKDEIAYLRNTLLPKITDQAQKEAVTKFLSAAEKLEKVETFNPLGPKSGPDAVEILTRMTQTVGDSVIPSSVPVATRIQEELDYRKKVNEDAGASVYTNTPKLRTILDSINKRLAQIEGIRLMGPSINNFLMTRGKDKLPEFKPDELATAENHLENQRAITIALIMESEENDSNAENRIREITLNRLKDALRAVDYAAELSAGTDYPVFEAVNKYREGIMKAVESTDFIAAQRLLMQMEDELFAKFSEKKGELINTFFNKESLDVFKLEDPKNSYMIEAYNYLRGILSVPSSDFWNAYHEAYKDSADTVNSVPRPSPSWEQDMVIKRTFQSLAADEYNPKLITAHPNRVNHHSSVFVQGKGGAGKSDYVIPTVAAVYQKKFGGKVLLTAFKDSRDVKRTKLVESVKGFYPNLPIVSVSRKLTDIVKDATLLKDVNLIIFDEATLLKSEELAAINSELIKLNKSRRDADMPILKLLLTGDTLQNNIDVDLNYPEVMPFGIDHAQRHVIDRVPQMKFSFRQGNQQLILLANYLEKIQKEAGRSDSFQGEYKGKKGTRFISDEKEFINHVSSFFNNLKDKNELHKAVYITDKSKFDVDPKIISTGVSIMNSSEAQGEQWDYVAFDPKTKGLFTDNKNIAVKKDIYTAATRAKIYFVGNYPENSGLSSREGVVNDIKPLSITRFNKETKLDDISNILGDSAAPVKKTQARKDVHVVPDFELFPGSQQSSGPAPAPPLPGTPVSSTPPGAPASATPTPKPAAPAPQPSPEPFPETGDERVDKVAKYIRENIKGGFVPLHSFFTDTTAKVLPEVFDKKRAALYDRKIIQSSPYFITIAKIGTAEYTNVIRNRPEFNGDYAMFLEAEVEGERIVLGVFQMGEFDKFINESGIMGQSSKLTLPISNSILAETQAWAPWPKDGVEQKLAEIKKKSPGIQFGTPRIHRINSADKNVKGQPKFKRGDVFIPVSFKYNPVEIDRVLNRRGNDEHISRIELRSIALPFRTVAAVLEKRYMFKDSKGKWKYNFSEEGGRMYDAFWGNLAKAHKNKEGKVTESVLARAFKDIYAAAPRGAYRNFISRYAGQVDPETAEMAKELQEATGKPTIGGTKTISKSQANYFLANYLVAKNAGAQEIRLFEQAIAELSAHPSFKEGFDFDPRIEFNSTSAVDDGDRRAVFEHAQAETLPSEVYDNMLKASVEYVSMPSLLLPKEGVLNVLKKAFAIDNVPAISTSASGTTSNQSPSDPNNDNTKVRPFEHLEDMSILGFYNRWFKKPGYITFMPETIFRFRNMMFDAIFSLNNPATGPRLREINDVMKEFREDYKTFKGKYSGDFLDSLDPVNDDKARELYMMGVIYNEMPFLIRKYFPSIVKSKILNSETGKKEDTYVYRSSHRKQAHFNEKESFNLLADGMTEMVKTQLYNTPIIQRARGGFKKTRDFINSSHIEPIVKMVKGATTSEEVAEKLLDSGSDIGLSLYHRFYNPEPFKLDGRETRSIGSIAHPEVQKMVDSVSLFMLSGQVFDLASVDLDENKFSLPNQAFGVPNILKEVMHQSLNSVAQEQGDQIYSFDDGSYVINNVKVEPSKNKDVTEDDLVKAINAMGLTNFTHKVLQEMYTYDSTKLAVTPNQDQAIMESQVRSQLMDSVVIPTIAEMRGKDVRFTGRVAVLYDAVSREAGIKGTLSHRNIDGEIMYRLRYTAPLFRLRERLDEIRDEARSVVSDNLIVKGNYEIIDTYLWEGVKRQERPKSHKSMSAEETMELDILWGFAYSLNEDHRKGRKYEVASLPGMVYSDSSSDVKFIVRAKDGYFRAPDTIANELFEANRLYIEKVGAEVNNWWNMFFRVHGRPEQFSSLPELAAYLDANEVPASAVSTTPGVIRNLFFINQGGKAVLKPGLIADYNSLTGPKGEEEFKAKLEANYKKLADRAKTITDASGQKLWDKMNKLIEDKSPDALLKSFYYNWVSFSQQLHLITNGSEYQYEDKGKGESQAYIDLVKRAKLQISNRSHQLFRNKSWLARWKEAKTQGAEGPALEALRYEGKKLPRVGRIAYVKDPVKALVNLVGETKMQEVYDGGTFVSPLTRLMQFHSNAGEHGINASPVMKNVTTYFNTKLGTNTSIKNAEFLLTPELIRQGNPVVGRLVQRMLMIPFDAPINGKNNAYELLQSLGVSPDLRNAEWTHFEQLLDLLVDNAQQDKLILEVAPITSVKTGVSMVNEFDPMGLAAPAEGQTEPTEDIVPYLSEPIDLVSKGTQLDASHAIEDIPDIIAPTQGISALVLNWTEPEAIQRVLNGLVKIAEITKAEFTDKEDIELIERMKAFVAKSVANKENISYLAEITDPSNGNQYSLDDRQVVNSFIRNFNAYLSDNAITPNFEGGHFVLHPTSGLIPVFEVGGRVGLRSTFKPEELGDNPGRDLKWASPTRADGVSLHKLIEDIYIGATGSVTLADAITTSKQNPEVRATIAAEIKALHDTLKGGEWKPGFAEILLPAEMFKDFGIDRELFPTLQPDQITPQLFGQLLREKHPKMDRGLLAQKAVAMHESFQKRLAGILARVPGTGPHSAVTTKVVGFLNESQNAVFAPAELLFVQGADQDIDKGFYMTLEAVEGIIPEIDQDYKLINGELFSDGARQRALLAGIKNDVVRNYVTVSSSPAAAIASNISVDGAMQEWIELASQLEQGTTYSRFDFTSYADMKEINQSGKNMVGIFANANKAYQIMYAAFKIAGISDATLAGLNDEYGSTWVKLAALINLATDNAKLQVLGRLGIGEHNGNMVSYLIMKGASPKDIVDFLQKYEGQMKQLKDARRFDAEGFFNAQNWGDPELASVYYMGQELGTFARSIMNRGLPNGPDEMYTYIYNMNRAINKTYKNLGMSQDFDLIRFISSETVRNQQIQKYGRLRGMTAEDGTRYSEFNILQAMASTPHVMGYLSTFNVAHQVVNKVSKAYRITNAIIENLEELRVEPDYYRDVQDFAYGLFIQDYFKANDTVIDGHNLGTIEGRIDFVDEMNSQEYTDIMKLKYPDNSFVNSLSREDHKRYNFDTRKRLRTHDLMQMLEEKLLRLRVDFAAIRPEDREKLVAYHLIVDKGRISKGSFGQLLEPADLKAFNQHLVTMDPSKFDYKRLAELYFSFKRPGDLSSIPHNAIPYSDKTFGITNEEGRTTAPVQMAESPESIRIPKGIRDIIKRVGSDIKGPLSSNIENLRQLSTDPRVTAAEYVIIERVLRNYNKFVLDRSDKETLQRIIDCA